DVLRNAVVPHGVEPVAEAVRAAPGGVDPRHRGIARGVERQRPGIARRRRRALAEDFGRYALGDLADVSAITEQKRRIRLALDIDKPGRDHESRGINAALRARIREGARRRHPYDPIASDRHIASEPGVAGAIDHMATPNNDIIAGIGGGVGGRLGAGGGEEACHGDKPYTSCIHECRYWPAPLGRARPSLTEDGSDGFPLEHDWAPGRRFAARASSRPENQRAERARAGASTRSWGKDGRSADRGRSDRKSVV